MGVQNLLAYPHTTTIQIWWCDTCISQLLKALNIFYGEWAVRPWRWDILGLDHWGRKCIDFLPLWFIDTMCFLLFGGPLISRHPVHQHSSTTPGRLPGVFFYPTVTPAQFHTVPAKTHRVFPGSYMYIPRGSARTFHTTIQHQGNRAVFVGERKSRM